MSLYWSVSAGFGLFQNITLKFPRVRRIFGIPKTALESEKPFKHLASIIAERAVKFLEIQEGHRRKK